MTNQTIDTHALPGALISPDHALPLVVRPASAGVDPVSWAVANRQRIRKLAHRHGGLLFRGFAVGSVKLFRRFISAVAGEPLRYTERSSPRHEVGDRVYTSTDHPPDQRIYLHNEQSYNTTWPMWIFFHCVVPPAAGGGTPLADCRRIYDRVSPDVRDRLEASGYAYVRHFGTGLGLSWREAFQAEERAEVESYCRRHDIEYVWGPVETLATRQVRPVVARHPVTGERTWFNHLTFFHVSTLEPTLARALLAMGTDKLPNNTYYGDGSDIELEVLNELRVAYEAVTVVVPWKRGDILMLDNMLTAHGREAFAPPRRIVVGMAEPMSISR
jgi:alpha-ketoglutarate-dependent taurine dioxygenase